MTARAWLNTGLLALLVGLALIVWLRPGQKPEADTSIASLDPDVVTRIQIQRAGKPTIALERQDGQWSLTAPIALPANEVRVGTLLNLAEKTSESRYDAAELKLAKYGLAEPKVSVMLNDRAFVFGDINPVTYQRYVRVGDRVYLISDDLIDLDTAEAAAYASPKLLPAGSEIRALNLPYVRLEREDDGRWRRSSDALSPAEIHTLLDAWRKAHAYRVASLKKNSTRRSRERIVVTLTDGREVEFAIIARKPELILARPQLGIQYHLPPDAVSSVLRPESRAAKASTEQRPG
jgi:uncharacterized protein DUF4340